LDTYNIRLLLLLGNTLSWFNWKRAKSPLKLSAATKSDLVSSHSDLRIAFASLQL
jgi:hypothetical protein